MNYSSFLKLAALINPFMATQIYSKSTSNGPITPSVRLGVALRYYARGSSYDITSMFGIGVSKVYKSVWEVIEAIILTPDLDIQFPSTFEEQKKYNRIQKQKCRFD